MSEEPNIVRIKLKRGAWEIEISCKEEKVKQVVESVLSGMAISGSGAGAAGELLAQEIKRPARGSTTCKGLMEALWGEGWFGSERNLSEVHEELSRRGYNYDKTAVSHSLTDLVREGVLTRAGSMRAYRYIQKRPPETDADSASETTTTAT
ncbi:MAG: hypothetical protein ACE5JV_01235 [Nitrososphaerales archaeon]